MKNLYLCICL